MSNAKLIPLTAENQLGNQTQIILGQVTAPLLQVGADLGRQVKSIQTLAQGVSRAVAEVAGHNRLTREIDSIKRQLAPLGYLHSALVQEKERIFQAQREWLSPYVRLQKEIGKEVNRIDQARREAVRGVNFFPFHTQELLKQFSAPARLAEELRPSFSAFAIPRFPRMDISAAIKEMVPPFCKEINRVNQARREAVRSTNLFPFQRLFEKWRRPLAGLANQCFSDRPLGFPENTRWALLPKFLSCLDQSTFQTASHTQELLKQFSAPTRLAEELRSSFSAFATPQFPRMDISVAIKEMMPPSWREQFREYLPLLLRQMRMETCAGAQAAVLNGNLEAIDMFCEELMLDPYQYRIAVAEALWEKGWIHADNPLAYVATAAARKVRKQRAELNGSMFGPTLLSLDAPVSTDRETFPLHALIPSPQDPLAEVEVNRDFERACLLAGLSPDATVIARLYHRCEGMISRRNLPIILGWSPQRTEATLRDFQRKRERLRKFLGIYKGSS